MILDFNNNILINTQDINNNRVSYFINRKDLQGTVFVYKDNICIDDVYNKNDIKIERAFSIEPDISETLKELIEENETMYVYKNHAFRLAIIK